MVAPAFCTFCTLGAFDAQVSKKTVFFTCFLRLF